MHEPVYCKEINELACEIISAMNRGNLNQAFTVAISGIDASGKGHTAKLLQEVLEQRGYRVANINLDPWQNPIPVRLQEKNAAENFYNHVFRWKDVFEQLILPLKMNKSICLQTKLIRTDADKYYNYTYHYENIDILLLDAILLFQQKFLNYYDFRIWVDCSFETGLQRAIRRNVEKLDEEKLKMDYDKYYYAAQRLHLAKDNPVSLADLIYKNDL